MTQTAPIPRGLIPLLSAANFVIGVGAFSVIGILTPMAQGLGMTTAQAGWVMSTYAIAYAVLSPLLVSSTGHIGRRRVLASGLAVFTLAAAISAMAPSATVLFAARVLAAAGAGVITPVAAAVIGALAPPEHRARSLANVFFGLTLAQVIGVPVAAWLAYTYGWRAPFVVICALALPIVWLLWTRVPAGLRFQPVTLRDLARVLTNWRLMLAILFTASFIGAIYVPFAFLAPLIETGMGFGRDGVSTMLILYGLGAVIGNRLGGYLADRIGAFRTLLLLSLTQIPLVIPMSFLPLPLPVFCAVFLAWSTCGWSFMTAQQSRLISLAPETAPVAMSLNAAAIYLGAAIGTAAGGVILEAHGLLALGIAGAIAMVLPVAHILISQRLSG